MKSYHMTVSEENVFHSFRAVKMVMKGLRTIYGLDPGKYRNILKRAGYDYGKILSSLMISEDLYSILDELQRLWNEFELGKMDVESVSPNEAKLKIVECCDCTGIKYGIGVTLCPFKEGLIEGVLYHKLKHKFNVVEIECCGTFHEGCRFKIR